MSEEVDGCARPGRILGVDIGLRRVGLAVSDPARKMALPLDVVLRERGEPIGPLLGGVVEEQSIELIVVGLPLRTDGTAGPEARAIQRDAAAFGKFVDRPIRFVDERFTTRIARAAGHEFGISVKKQKASVDKVAAAIILQSHLDQSHIDQSQGH